jgi:hypothetical protein
VGGAAADAELEVDAAAAECDVVGHDLMPSERFVGHLHHRQGVHAPCE